MATRNNKDCYQAYDSPMYSLSGVNMALVDPDRRKGLTDQKNLQDGI